MTFSDITFISSRGRKMTPNLYLTKKYLSMQNADITFRYFIDKENVSNPMEKKSVEICKNNFCQKSSNIICNDASLSGKLSFPTGDNCRLLIFSLYDYIFETYIMHANIQSPSLRPTFKNFTHILVSSPFGCDVLKKSYACEHLKIIDQIPSPLSYELCRSENAEKMRKYLSDRYPGISDKKIISFLVTKDAELETGFFDGFNLKNFFSDLDDSYFIFTNSTKLMLQSSILNSSYSDKFGYVGHIFPHYYLLFCSDILITNESLYATEFSARRLPVYTLKYKNSFFEKYMSDIYPQIHLQKSEELYSLATSNFQFTDIHGDFCDHFSYSSPGATPYEVIEDII